MLENLQKELAKRGIVFSESAISMLLGAFVVILVGLLAYNYFRTARSDNQDVQPAETIESLDGELSQGGTAVALPATHTVAQGENLWSIAEKYYRSGYNYVDVAEANQLISADYLEPGQNLTIPKVEVRVPLTVSEPLVVEVVDSKITANQYSVIQGDTLWAIALRAYGDPYRYPEIAKANNLVNPSVIEINQNLTIPR